MTTPSKAMVLAAGLGQRMRPITEHTPKPLIEIGGRTMLDRALDHLEAAGVQEAVVNVHHLGHKVRNHLADRRCPAIVISDETNELLETGGGVKQALPLLGTDPFFVVNADVVWLDGARPSVLRLTEAWDPARMDVLLLMKDKADAHGYEGDGDFFMDTDHRAQRRKPAEFAPYIYAGVQILNPTLFDGMPDGAFSLNKVFDRALADDRLYGLAHDGPWFHVGRPDAIAPTERMIRATESVGWHA